MTTACNSAHVQTETLNFTFARQAAVVYFDAEFGIPKINASPIIFLPIMSEYALIASKQSIQPLTQADTELLMILVQTCRIAMETWMYRTPKTQPALYYICQQTSKLAQTTQNKCTPINYAMGAMMSHL